MVLGALCVACHAALRSALRRPPCNRREIEDSGSPPSLPCPRIKVKEVKTGRGRNENESEERAGVQEDGQECAQGIRMMGKGPLEAMNFNGMKRFVTSEGN